MNIFLPYINIEQSIKSLDDLRLNKQILECRTLYENAIGIRDGYSHHPVSVHYAKYPGFIIYYGYLCCQEYYYRFSKAHNYQDYFEELFLNKCALQGGTHFEPIYVEGSKDSPNAIRETNPEKVEMLFKAKLLRKWQHDCDMHHAPKWTTRKPPEFIAKEMRK